MVILMADMIKHSEISTIEEYKEYKRQMARKYYREHAEEIKAKHKERYYNMKKNKDNK